MSDNTIQPSAKLAFVVPQPEFLAAVAFVAKGIPSRPVVPVLAGLVITSDGETVTVESFDYDQSRRVVLPNAKCTAPGSVLVGGSQLHTMVKALPTDRPVAFAGEGTNARMSNGKTTYTVPTMPIEDYPSRPDMPTVVGMIDGSALAAVIGQVAKFAGKDATLPMMTGIRVSSEGEHLYLEATDRYRLAVRDFAWAPDVDKFAALVPGKLLTEVVTHVGKQGGAVTALGHGTSGPTEGWFGIETDHVRVVMRTLEGANYPKVRGLIPKHTIRQVDVDAAALVAAVKRIAVVAGKAAPVLLRMGADTLTIEGGSTYDGGASEQFDGAVFVDTKKAHAAAVKAEVEAAKTRAKRVYEKLPEQEREAKVAKALDDARKQFSGLYVSMLVAANPAYLTDVLTTTGAKRVRMSFLSPFKPFTVVPLDGDGEPVPGVMNLLMTIRVTTGEGEEPMVTDSKAVEAALAATSGATPSKPKAKPSKAVTAAAVPVETVEAEPVAAPAPPADEQETPDTTAAEFVRLAAAAAEEVLDPNVEHLWRRAVEDGTKPNPFTKCRCGKIRNAKVHGGKQAAARTAQADGETTKAPTVPAGPIWMAVLQLTAQVRGQMQTQGTEAGAYEAVKQFGNDKTVGVLVVDTDSGKRMYVGTRSREDAQVMQMTACAKAIPAHTVQGEWPSQGAAADNGLDGAQVKAQEKSPVIVGEPLFEPQAASIEARAKFANGDFEGALALVEQGKQVAPKHMFSDGKGRTYGWDLIERAILAKQVEQEIADEARRDALADVAVEAGAVADVDVVADGSEHAEVQVDEVAADEPVEEPELVQRLREALAGQPQEVIDRAVEAAMAAAEAQKVPAGPVGQVKDGKKARKAAKKAAKGAEGAKAAAVPQVPVERKPVAPAKANTVPAAVPGQAGEVEQWKAFGMVPPATVTGERVWILPVGTRLRALRAGVLAGLKAAQITQMPIVEADKTERPYRLRVRFTEAGALTAVSVLVNDTVAAVLPDVLPARVNA